MAYGYAHDGSETGTGKTYVTAALLAALGGEALILAPLSTLPQWGETLNGFGFVNYTVMNYELAWRRLGAVKPWGTGSFFEFHRKYDRIVFDEAQRCGGETTISSKMMIAAKRSGAQILTSSATIAETPVRMRAFGYVLGLHTLNNHNGWINFLMRCQCKPGTFGGWTFSGKKYPEVLDMLNAEIYGAGKGARMRKAEIPDFPKMTTEVRLLGSQDKQLQRMSEELRAHYNERNVKAVILGAKIEKKRKLAQETGQMQEPSGDELARMTFLRQSLETAKVPLLGDMIEDALEDSKVVVFCNFNETIEQLKKLASSKKWRWGLIRGKQKDGHDEEREETKKKFQANEIDTLFCNIQAGGVGLSLHDPVSQIPRTQIICPSFSGEALIQAMGRSNRQGGGYSRNLLVYFDDSFEGVIARILRGKLDNLDRLNDVELSGNFR